MRMYAIRHHGQLGCFSERVWESMEWMSSLHGCLTWAEYLRLYPEAEVVEVYLSEVCTLPMFTTLADGLAWAVEREMV